MTQVCKDVGWDGQGFYCLRCGKAGFQSEAQARGHLSQCKGRAVARGIFPSAFGMLPRPPDSGCCEQVVLPPGAPPVGGGTYHPFSGAGGGAPGGQSTAHGLGNFGAMSTQFSPEPGGYPGYVGQQLASHAAEIAQLKNEYHHMLMDRNQPQYSSIKQDFFSQYKGVIIVGAIILFAVILSNQSKSCQAVSGSKGVDVGNIGIKALSKLVDTGISKGVSALFK